MAMRVSSRFSQNDENATIIGKSAQKVPPGLKSASHRPKLSNITNKIPERTPARDFSALKPVKQQQLQQLQQQRVQPGKTTVKVPKSAKKRQELQLPAGPFNLTAEQERQAEVWAKEGIERVHFTGDDMEDLRRKMDREEIEQRVKVALSFRTELFPVWERSPPVDDPFTSDGELKLDTFEQTFNGSDEEDIADCLDKLLLRSPLCKQR